MKSGLEFGILRSDLTSTTPQQTLRRKHPSHDLVLNNEECVPANTYQGHYCFTEVTDHAARKPFLGMTKVAALELCEAPGKTSTTLSSQSTGMIPISKPQRPAHVIAIPTPTQINQFRMDQRASNPEIYRHRKKEICRRKWLM